MTAANKYGNKSGAIIIEGHVQGLSNTRSLGEAGIPVYVVDKTDCIARYSRYCTKFFRGPDFIQDEFADFLIDLAIRERINSWVLIPSNDHAVYTISKHKARLEAYYKVITSGLEIINNIYDKAKLIEIARKQNIPVPLTQIFTSEDETLNQDLHFPVITKGRHGLSFYKAIGKKALLAHNQKELRNHLKLIHEKYTIDATFTQELIPYNGINNTISFTAFCVNGEIKTHWSGVKIREHPARFGTATFTTSMYNETCHKQSIPLLNTLKYTGVCEVEYLLDSRDNKYKLIEINPRTWLWVGLAKECGVDYAKLMYDFASGNPIIWPTSYKLDLTWRNPFSDLIYSMVAILKGKLKIKDYIYFISNKKISNALFKRGDMNPGYMYFLKMFSFLSHR